MSILSIEQLKKHYLFFYLEKNYKICNSEIIQKNNEINNLQYMYNGVGEIRRVVLLHNFKSLKYTITLCQKQRVIIFKSIQ